MVCQKRGSLLLCGSKVVELVEMDRMVIVGTTQGCMYMRSVEKTLNCKMIISRLHEEAQLFISFPKVVAHSLFCTKRWELTVSSPKRWKLTVSSYPIPLCCASQRWIKRVCVAVVATKECVLPLLQQRSVCCCCCSKGVCVAAIAAKEWSESCSKRNCVPAIPTLLDFFICLRVIVIVIIKSYSLC